MSKLSTIDEYEGQLPDLRVNEFTGSPNRSETVSTDESLDPTATGNTFIATLPHGDDTQRDPRTTPARGRNTSLVDVVDPSTTFPTRNDNIDETEQTSTCSNIPASSKVTYDYRIGPSVSFPTGDDDRGATGKPTSSLFSHNFDSSVMSNEMFYSNTNSLQQIPVSTSSQWIEQQSDMSMNSQSNLPAEEMSQSMEEPPTEEMSESMEESRILDMISLLQFPVSTSPEWIEQQSNLSMNSQPYLPTEEMSQSVEEPSPTQEMSQSVEEPRILNTISLQQLPVSTSCNIAGGTHVQNTIGTLPSLSTAVHVQSTTSMTHREQTPHGTSTPRRYRPILSKPSSTSPRVLTYIGCSGNSYPDSPSPDSLYNTDGETLHECESCGSQYRSAGNFERHIALKHNDNVGLPVKCNVCHSIHIGEKPFKCNLCGRRFWHEFDMLLHCRVHTDYRPFKCNFCGRTFWKKSFFLQHKPEFSM